MFLVVAVHFGFQQPYFFACPIGCAPEKFGAKKSLSTPDRIVFKEVRQLCLVIPIIKGPRQYSLLILNEFKRID